VCVQLSMQLNKRLIKDLRVNIFMLVCRQTVVYNRGRYYFWKRDHWTRLANRKVDLQRM